VEFPQHDAKTADHAAASLIAVGKLTVRRSLKKGITHKQYIPSWKILLIPNSSNLTRWLCSKCGESPLRVWCVPCMSGLGLPQSVSCS